MQLGRWAFSMGCCALKVCALAPRAYAGGREMSVCAEFTLLSESVLFDASMLCEEHYIKWRRCWFAKSRSLYRGSCFLFSQTRWAWSAILCLVLSVELLDSPYDEIIAAMPSSPMASTRLAALPLQLWASAARADVFAHGPGARSLKMDQDGACE